DRDGDQDPDAEAGNLPLALAAEEDPAAGVAHAGGWPPGPLAGGWSGFFLGVAGAEVAGSGFFLGVAGAGAPVSWMPWRAAGGSGLGPAGLAAGPFGFAAGGRAAGLLDAGAPFGVVAGCLG